MKRFFLTLGFIVLIGAFFLGGVFYWQNLRGSGAAFGPIPALPSRRPLQPSQNSTGLSLSLPNGFSLSTFAQDLKGPRVLLFDSQGTLLVSMPSAGEIVALPDRNHDGSSDLPVIVANGLHEPHGLAFQNGQLYVAETDQVSVFSYNAGTNKATNKRKIVDLPGGGNHFSRTIGFGPDGKLYISVGSSCNVCIEKDTRRAKILIANSDGSGLREYASGLRNSVFFTWHPKTHEIWATDMGRDLLGDNIPADEVNIIKDGGFYGWPYCYEDRIHDTQFDPGGRGTSLCGQSIPPLIKFPAHSAPLGIGFIPDSWPEEYRGKLLVAFHGSWNRSEPTGYKVIMVDLDKDSHPTRQTDFLSGWLVKRGALGRPVDLVFDEKGVLYISDDKAGTIYRVTPIP